MSLPASNARAQPALRWLKKPTPVALLLGACTILLLTLTAPDIGLTWDEPAYIAASESYLDWFGQLARQPGFALSQEGIDRYWCETYAQALEHLNRNAPPGAVVWIQDWSHDVMFYYQLHDQLRSDLRITWPEDGSSVFDSRRAEGVPVPMDEADYVVLQHRETGFTDEIRRYMSGRTPVYRLTCQGIPLLDIYEN